VIKCGVKVSRIRGAMGEGEHAYESKVTADEDKTGAGSGVLAPVHIALTGRISP